MLEHPKIKASWIAADWGTSNLRVWAMDDDDRPLANARSEQGMSALTRDEFGPVLMNLIGPWLGPDRIDVVACGMVGARQGWVEAPYSDVPCAPLNSRFSRTDVPGHPVSVHVVPGLRQIEHPDVMRGEETQVAGFLDAHPNWDGVICLPGTHSKWVHVSAGEVVSFQTFMTGELFDVIAHQTVLRHSLEDKGWSDEAFADALDDAISRPERMAARLFSLRADHLINGLDGARARARLSGYLIGAELAAARPYWLGQAVAIVAEPTIGRAYETALAKQGVTATAEVAEDLTCRGLAVAHRLLRKD